jgi:uncharacterized membrane protein
MKVASLLILLLFLGGPRINSNQVSWVISAFPCSNRSSAAKGFATTTNKDSFRSLLLWEVLDASHFPYPAPRLHQSTRLRHGNQSHNKDNDGDELNVVQDPQLISSQIDDVQRLVFVSAFALLGVGTSLCIDLWYRYGRDVLLGAENFHFIRGTVFPISFGVIFALVGVLHFWFVDNFANIVPPRGTWGGIWQLPAPGLEQLNLSYAAYLSYVSGIVEFFGGVWLVWAGLQSGSNAVIVPASLLFLVTIAVSPANLYMFTHDAQPGGIIPKLPRPYGHFGRFILQCGLLSNFWIMAHP